MQELDIATQSQNAERAPAQDRDAQILALLNGSAKPEKSESVAEKPEKALPGPEMEENPQDGAKPEKAQDDEALEPEKVQKPEIDYKQKIPMADGQAVELGALKDAYQTREADKLEILNEKTAIAADRLEISRLFAGIRELPPAVVELAQRAAAEDFKRNRDALAAVMPQALTKQGGAEIEDRLYEGLKRFNFTREEIRGGTDYRLYWAMDTILKELDAVKAARAKLKPISEARARSAAKPADVDSVQGQINQALATRNRAQAGAAINSLLRRT